MDWLRSTTYRGRFDEPLHRSALALKLMQYLPTGAFVAAPTSSLPESRGGALKWGYPYNRVRGTPPPGNPPCGKGFDDGGDGLMRRGRPAPQPRPQDFQIVDR